MLAGRVLRNGVPGAGDPARRDLPISRFLEVFRLLVSTDCIHLSIAKWYSDAPVAGWGEHCVPPESPAFAAIAGLPQCSKCEDKRVGWQPADMANDAIWILRLLVARQEGVHGLQHVRTYKEVADFYVGDHEISKGKVRNAMPTM